MTTRQNQASAVHGLKCADLVDAMGGCIATAVTSRLRDFDELARYDFAAYCSGEATRWGGDRVTPFQANVPVVLQGVGVVPGQYVFADSSGAVLIPDGQIDAVLAEARKVEATDAPDVDDGAAQDASADDARPRDRRRGHAAAGSRS